MLNNYQFLEFIYPKMFFAVCTGSIIGFERGSRKAAAGFKTHILICLGSMFYTVVPVILDDMVVRDQHVIAQIVTGIGFLGAGAIIRNTATEKQPVQGLTTAADIWLVAALGILVGLGYGWSVVLISVIVVSITVTSRHIERKYINHSLDKPKHDKKIKAPDQVV